MERLSDQDFELQVTEAQKEYRDLREYLWPVSRGLTDLEKKRLKRFFSGDILDSVRVFKDLLQMFQGPDEEIFAGVNVIDIIIDFDTTHTAGQRAQVFFHEIVHILQFRILGTDLAIREGLRSLKDGNGRINSPLEEQAYRLQRRFTHEDGFDAESAVRAGLAGLGYKL